MQYTLHATSKNEKVGTTNVPWKKTFANVPQRKTCDNVIKMLQQRIRWELVWKNENEK
jgi:hypothetical protein